MTKLSRRSMLRVVAIAPAAAVAATMPAIAPAQAAENPDLIALGESVDVMLETYRGHVRARETARWFFDQARPKLPTELVRERATDRFYLQDCCDREYDIDGNMVHRDGLPDREIFSSRLLRSDIIIYDVSRHTKRGKVMRRLVMVAKQYEVGTAKALKQSGYEVCKDRAQSAAFKIRQLIDELREIKPTTIEGVLVYARASAAYDECGKDAGDGGGLGGGWKLGSRLADAILKIAGPAVRS